MDPIQAALDRKFGKATTATPSTNSLLEAALDREFGPRPQPKEPGVGAVVLDTAKDVGKAVVKGLADAGSGAGRNIGETMFGTAALVPKGAGFAAGLVGAEGFKDKMYGVSDTVRTFGEDLYKAPPDIAGLLGVKKPGEAYLPSTESTMAKIGSAASDVAMLAAPISPAAQAVNKGQKVLGQGAKLARVATDGIPFLGKAVGYGLETAAHVLPEAALGYTYGQVHGSEKPMNDALLFGGGSLVGKLGGDAFKAWRGDLADNVAKAFGTKGKVGNSLQAKSIGVPQANLGAMETLYDLKDKIKVTDINGNQKVFNPLNTDLMEMTQAVKQAQKMTFDAFDKLATEAGEAGAKVTQKDFEMVMKPLQDVLNNKNAGKAIREIAQSEMDDFLSAYAVKDAAGKVAVDPKTGLPMFVEASLKDVQEYMQMNLVPRIISKLQDQNTRILGQQLKTMRDMVDDKIESVGGEGYNAFRQRYAELKTLEQGVAYRFNQEIGRRAGSVPDWVQGFGGLDILQGIVTANPSQAAHGVAQIFLGRVLQQYRNTDPYIRKAFKLIDQIKNTNVTPMQSAIERAFGARNPANPLKGRTPLPTDSIPNAEITNDLMGL